MSFCVSFTSYHHNGLAGLRGIRQSGVDQEYDGDEPPHQVPARILGERGYMIQTDRLGSEVGAHVVLIALQVEIAASWQRDGQVEAPGESVDRLNEARNRIEVHGLRLDGIRPILSHHLA